MCGKLLNSMVICCLIALKSLHQQRLHNLTDIKDSNASLLDKFVVIPILGHLH